MHDDDSQPREARCKFSPTASDDAGVQHGLLAVVLAEHPAQLTIAELLREMCRSSEDFSERDAVERAVRDLVGVGLLHRQGVFVLPTRAALHFDRLEQDRDADPGEKPR